MATGLIETERLRAALTTERIARRVIYLDETTSTNDEVARRLAEDDADGLVVIAEHQTAGRGRRGRAWHSPRSASVLASVAIVDREEAFPGGCLALVCGIAVVDALSPCVDVRPTLKWPNDVLARGRKLAGILVESRTVRGGARCFILGIGINCLQHRGHFPDELADNATSVELESGQPVDRTAICASLLNELDGWLAVADRCRGPALRDAWLARSDILGKRIEIGENGGRYRGHVVDLDPEAGLIVRLDTGQVRVLHSGDTTDIDEGRRVTA